MKKFFAMMLTVCLLGICCAASADTEEPTFDSMPLAVMEGDDPTLSEESFQGVWVLKAAFAARDYVNQETLFDVYGYDFVPYTIADGKITKEVEDREQEFRTIEMPYTFEAGQLWATDEKGRDVVVEKLEDGNIVMSVFYPAEDDTVTCLSLFMVHPEE